jgi:hypothetical protein
MPQAGHAREVSSRAAATTFVTAVTFASSAHTMRDLVNALAGQAELLRLLLPHLRQETLSGLMERAGAGQWHAR